MEKKVLVETSARHVHVTREALDILFGEGYELTVKKELSQPGQFASNERVAVIGPKGSTTPSKGLNTNNAAACIKAYQAAVNATKQFKSGRQNMALKGSITADGSLGALLKIAQKPVANALNKNSKDRTDIPGKPSGMQASHMKSASAVTSGNYTTITFNVKDQTQGAKADNHSGSVGCAVGTLGDVDNAIRELGLSVDYKDGKIELTYTNCKVVVKIDNTTGKIVEGSWAYDVNVYANGIKVSIVSVNNLKGIVAFSYTAKG